MIKKIIMVSALVCLGGALIPLGFIVYYFASDGMFRCEETVLLESVSPDGSYKAVHFSMGCGATTRESWHVAIETDGDSHRILDVEGKLKPTFVWLSNNELLIRNTGPTEEVFLRKETLGPLHITYDGVQAVRPES